MECQVSYGFLQCISTSFKGVSDLETCMYVTFHEQQDCGYGFPSLPLAMHVSADVLIFSKSGEATGA